MYFSGDDTVAHIWCVEAENPLIRVRADDFPEVWSRLEVGSVVLLSAARGICPDRDVRHLEIVE